MRRGLRAHEHRLAALFGVLATVALAVTLLATPAPRTSAASSSATPAAVTAEWPAESQSALHSQAASGVQALRAHQPQTCLTPGPSVPPALVRSAMADAPRLAASTVTRLPLRVLLCTWLI